MKPTRGTVGHAMQTLHIRGKARACNYQRRKWKGGGKGGGSRACSGAATKFHFPPFLFSANATPRTFYPIFRRYKLILISERARCGGREGRAVGFIGIRVTRCDVIVALTSPVHRS